MAGGAGRRASPYLSFHWCSSVIAAASTDTDVPTCARRTA